MCNNNENNYSKVLNKINIPNLQPKSILMYFEQAFIKSFKEFRRLNTVVKGYSETNKNKYLKSIAYITWYYNYTYINFFSNILSKIYFNIYFNIFILYIIHLSM